MVTDGLLSDLACHLGCSFSLDLLQLCHQFSLVVTAVNIVIFILLITSTQRINLEDLLTL